MGHITHLANQMSIFFNHVKKGRDIYSKLYDKYMLIGDFNTEESEPCLPQFLFEIKAKKYC